jgi:hypothetical protein
MKAESFITFLDAYGESRKPTLRFSPDRPFDTWQGQFRNAVTSLRGPVPTRVEPEVEILETVDASDHERQLIRIQVSEISVLTAYLLIPKDIGADEKRSALIASHGHTQRGIDTTCGVRGMEDGDNAKRAYGLDAVRSGYVVLAPAWWGWRGRDGHLDRIGNRDKCNVIQNAASMYGMNSDRSARSGRAGRHRCPRLPA